MGNLQAATSASHELSISVVDNVYIKDIRKRSLCSR